MDHNLQNETQDHPQDVSTEWAEFPIRDSRQSLEDIYTNSSYNSWYDPKLVLKPDSMVVMGDYLIILAFDWVDADHVRDDDRLRDTPCYNHLLAVDLKDLSVQEVEIDDEENWSFHEEGYTLRKYKNDQIIAFYEYDCSQIIIKSFQPFSVELKRVNMGKKIKCNHSAQIYNDGFYMFDSDSPLNTLWRFDLKNKAWKECKTVGGDPGLNEIRNSFIFKDNLYVSGGHLYRDSYDFVPEKKIFMLNFETMEWRKFEQQEYYFEDCYWGGDIYNEHLMILSRNDKLHFWNIQANSWKTFNIKDPGFDLNCNIAVYKNSLLVVGESEGESEGEICLATYNLDSLGLEAPLSPEEEHLRALFLSEKDSDIKLKIQGEIIAAHKEVLINKSRFFAGLFQSGMAETKQDVIEIEDCDFVVFKEFIRFIYYNRFYFNEELLAVQLVNLADKYLQDDLKKRCADYLRAKVNPETVLPIFEVAYAKNLEDLMTPCVSHLTSNITLINITKIVECLIKKQNDYPRDLRDEVLDWIIENYFEIYKNLYQSLRLCEDFLIKNIEMKTIVRVSWFIDKYSKDAFFEKETIRSREALYCFVQENFQELREEPIAGSLAYRFLIDMMAYMFKLNENKPKFNQENEKEEKLKTREGKRMEPSQKDGELDEKPELKKTKK